MIFLSIIESIYLFYMFRHFKTSCDFNYLTQTDIFKDSDWFKHLEGDEYGVRICPFGQMIFYFLL